MSYLVGFVTIVTLILLVLVLVTLLRKWMDFCFWNFPDGWDVFMAALPAGLAIVGVFTYIYGSNY